MFVELMKEDGTVVEGFGLSPGALTKYLPLPNDEQFRCLGFIDHYGNTIFNRIQATALLKELDEISKVANETHKNELEKIKDLVKKLEDGLHLYLRFIGD